MQILQSSKDLQAFFSYNGLNLFCSLDYPEASHARCNSHSQEDQKKVISLRRITDCFFRALSEGAFAESVRVFQGFKHQRAFFSCSSERALSLSVVPSLRRTTLKPTS